MVLGQSLNQNCALHFHGNPDIFGEICEHLLPNDNPEDVTLTETTSSRNDFVRLALTCRDLLEPALDRLWRSLDAVHPLFRLLPTFTPIHGTHVLKGEFTPATWDRFDWYARRVQRLTYKWDPENPHIAMHVYFRISQLRSTPLLPSLRYLSCPDVSQGNFLVTTVLLFLPSSLQHLQLRWISTVEDKYCWSFLHTLWIDGAQLEVIELQGYGLSTETLTQVLNFQCLERLELTGFGPSINLDLVKGIGTTLKLIHLILDFTDTWMEAPISELGFTSLKNLTITAPLSFTLAFLSHTTTLALEQLTAASSLSSQAECRAFVRAVVERWDLTLLEFSLCHDGPPNEAEALDMEVISPLLKLRRLTGFALQGLSIHLDDNTVKIFGSAWPNIKTLLLPFASPLVTVRPTINSLYNLTALCPDLIQLRIPLHSSNIPPPLALIPQIFQPFQFGPISSSTRVNDFPAEEGNLNLSLPPTHGLRTLIIASRDETWKYGDMVGLARHIHRLFPLLQRILSFEANDDERWTHVGSLVKAFQDVQKETLPLL